MTIAHQIIQDKMANANGVMFKIICELLLKATNASAKVTTDQWASVERLIRLEVVNSKEVNHESILRWATFLNSCR